jgi:ribonuclease E
MPALSPAGLAWSYLTSTLHNDRWRGSASPTRSALDKFTRFRPFSVRSHADHRQPGLSDRQSEPAGESARPAAQRASGATARSAGASPPKPRAAISTGASRFAPGRARGDHPAARTGERAERGSRTPGSSAAPGREPSPRPEQLRRAESEAGGDRASTAPGAERPAGAKRRSERESSPDRSASAPSRSHAIDQPEARACPRPGRASATGDRREPLGGGAVLSSTDSRWSA